MEWQSRIRKVKHKQLISIKNRHENLITEKKKENFRDLQEALWKDKIED